MNEKKNLDRLFQEKFKDFEVAPPEFVWENIQEKLQGKKKRRVIPLWIRLSGVAALLAIGSIFLTPYFNGINSGDTPVVIDNGSQKSNPLQAQPEGSVPQNPGSTNTGSSSGQSSVNSAVATVATETAPSPESANDAVNGQGSTPTAKRQPSVITARSNNAVAVQGSRTTNRNTAKSNGVDREKTNLATQQLNEGLALNRPATEHQNNSVLGTTPNGQSREAIIKDTPANEGVAEYRPTGVDTTSEAGVAANEGSATTGQDAGETMPVLIDRNAPITEQAVAEAVVDTTATSLTENELEKLLQQKLNEKDNEKAVAENDKGKWNIRPQVAPVFYNSMTSGSPIDEQFSGNSKSFDNDLSFGLGVDYALSDRLRIRSGINTVNLSYATNDIEFHASLNTTTANVAPGGPGNNIVVQNPDTAGFVIEDTPTSTFEGAMVQTTGYLEVPLEMSYALVNKKFGIDVIGGVSTLFLNENNVSVVSGQGYRSDVGQAKNLNDIHFSTNVGIGFKYKFWSSFEANFEPMFKYQVNAYSRDAGNFRPYFIGLYSGVSFRF